MLKALKGEEETEFSLGRWEVVDSDSCHHERESRERVAEMEVYVASASPLLSLFATDTRTDNKWAGRDYTRRWLLLLPLVTGRR